MLSLILHFLKNNYNSNTTFLRSKDRVIPWQENLWNDFYPRRLDAYISDHGNFKLPYWSNSSVFIVNRHISGRALI